MEHDLVDGLRLRIPEGEVPLGADSLLLADFLTLPPRARVADLGAGCGTLGVLLCARDPSCTVAGHRAAAGGLPRRAGECPHQRAGGAADRSGGRCAAHPHAPSGGGFFLRDRQSALFSRGQRQGWPEQRRGPHGAVPDAGGAVHGGRLAAAARRAVCTRAPGRSACATCCASCARPGWSRSGCSRCGTMPKAPSVCCCSRQGGAGRPGLTLLPELLEYETDGTEREALRAARHAKGDCP